MSQADHITTRSLSSVVHPRESHIWDHIISLPILDLTDRLCSLRAVICKDGRVAGTIDGLHRVRDTDVTSFTVRPYSKVPASSKLSGLKRGTLIDHLLNSARDGEAVKIRWAMSLTAGAHKAETHCRLHRCSL